MRRALLIIGCLTLLAGAASPATRWAIARIDAWRYRPIDMTRVGAFPFDPRRGTLADVPADVRALDGRGVRVDGVVLPADIRDLMIGFDVLPSVPSRFGRQPAVQEYVTVLARLESVRRAFEERVSVRGTFHVDVRSDERGVWSVFRLDADDVGPSLVAGESVASTSVAAMALGSLLIAASLIAGRVAATRARRLGRCHACGYDLRASPERCPECGTARRFERSRFA